MSNKFTLILNAGRSGSTYIYNLLKSNFKNDCFVFHETLHCSITKPKVNNRLYSETEILEVLKVPQISHYLQSVEKMLKERPVIECGWTFSHLAPVLEYYFKDRFQVVFMYRNPFEFAASRSTMGNYQSNSYYEDKSHEVSPFDSKTFFPSLKIKWDKMSPFEKCLFWWLQSVSEGIEFLQLKKASTNTLEFKSEDIFKDKNIVKEIVQFIGLNNTVSIELNQNRNLLHAFTYESFPLKKTWMKLYDFTEVIELAKQLNYKIDTPENYEVKFEKYQLRNTFISKFRYFSRYWFVKKYIKNIFYI